LTSTTPQDRHSLFVLNIAVILVTVDGQITLSYIIIKLYERDDFG